MRRRRVLVLVRKEFLELRQMSHLLRLILIAPIIQLILLGYAATTDVRHVPVVVADADRTVRSRELIERFAASPHFEVVADEVDIHAVDRHLSRGDAWLALVIPAGLEAALERTGPPFRTDVQLLADGTDANSSGIALAYASGLVRDFNAGISAGHGGGAAPINVSVRVWYNPELVSRDFMVPGVLALLLLVVTANLSSMAIVRERELGTLEQLSVTPLTRWELILGKLLPYAIIGLLDAVMVVAVAVYWFRVPFDGSVLVLFGSALAYLICTLGLGLFVSTISSTQQHAMLTAIFFFLMPMIYLSGFTFPIENMPLVIQWVTYVIPLRYFLVIVRGVFLKGVGLDVLWPQLAGLLIYSDLTLAVRIEQTGVTRCVSRRHLRLRLSRVARQLYPESLPQADVRSLRRAVPDGGNHHLHLMPTEDDRGLATQAPAGFTHTLKAPRSITHIRRLKDRRWMGRFSATARAAGAHWPACCFSCRRFRCDAPVEAFLAGVPLTCVRL
jgi:ABC-2 type transport system permease protein